MKLIKIAFGIITLSLLAGPLTLAQTSDIGGVHLPGAVKKGSIGELLDILRAIVRLIYIIFFIIAVLFILFAAFNYLGAAGDTEKVNKAKNQLIYAAVAIIVALLAVGAETMIARFLASPT